jgi:integrase
VKDPKTHQARRVSLDEETLRLLKARRVTQSEAPLACGVRLDDDAYVLSELPAGTEPVHPVALSDRFRRLVWRLGITCRFHDLRHWHVSQALGIGVPVRDVADRVGHASARMTLDVYGHSINHDDRRAAEAAADLLKEASDPSRKRRRQAASGDSNLELFDE